MLAAPPPRTRLLGVLLAGLLTLAGASVLAGSGPTEPTHGAFEALPDRPYGVHASFTEDPADDADRDVVHEG